MNHGEITNIITAGGTIPYGVGITPNPYARQQKEWERRKQHKEVLGILTGKIEAIFEPRFITPPETSELIAAIVTASDSRRILELGTCTGFTTLHMLRAIYGKEGASITSIDARPAHDREFWARPEFCDWLKFVEGWTPEVLGTLTGKFDLVFIDSDHSVEHTIKELGALWGLTDEHSLFLFHDVPEWQTPTNQKPPPVREYLLAKVADGTFQGGILPTCEQLDCRADWGAGYPPQCNPHLGVFIRQ